MSARSRLAWWGALAVLLASAPPAAADDDSEGDDDEETPGDPADSDEVIVITGTRTERPLGTSAVATDVVTAETAEALGARTVADALAIVPGVTVAAGLGGAGVEIEGLGPEYTAVLIDGQRAIGRIDGTLDLTRFTLDRVDQIEVVRGPSSALYGADALAGVVNVITRLPEAPFETDAHVAGGSRDVLDAAARAGAAGEALSGEALSGSIGASWQRDGGYDLTPDDAATTASSLDQRGLDGRVIFAGDRLRLDATGDYQHRDQRGVDGNAAGAVFDRRNLTETGSLALRPAWRTAATSELRGMIRAGLYRDQFASDQRMSNALDQYQDTRERLYEASAQWERRGTDHTILVGGELVHEELRSERLVDGESDRQRAATFAQDEWLLGAWTLVPSARVDADTQFGVHLTPRLAARVDLAEGVVLRAAAGAGFRAPGFKELYLFFENPGAGYVVEGNPELAPESSIGARASLAWSPRDAVWLDVTGYRNDLSDMIVAASVDDGGAGGPQRFSYENLAEAHTQGVEARVRVAPWPQLVVEIGYALMLGEDESDGLALEGRARHRGHALAILQDPGKRVQLSASATAVGARPYYTDDDGDGTVETTFTAPYLVAGARLAVRLTANLELHAAAENLTGAGDDDLTPLAPRSFFFGASGHFATKERNRP